MAPKFVSDLPRPVRELETVWIEMPDGCRLAARIWLPEDAEQSPVPAILEHLPYRRRDYTRLRGDESHRYIAGLGYAGVRVDMRGSGDSDGLLEDEYLQQELDDAVVVRALVHDVAGAHDAVGAAALQELERALELPGLCVNV